MSGFGGQDVADHPGDACRVLAGREKKDVADASWPVSEWAKMIGYDAMNVLSKAVPYVKLISSTSKMRVLLGPISALTWRSP